VDRVEPWTIFGQRSWTACFDGAKSVHFLQTTDLFLSLYLPNRDLEWVVGLSEDIQSNKLSDLRRVCTGHAP
jgi:hypothetical protein